MSYGPIRAPLLIVIAQRLSRPWKLSISWRSFKTVPGRSCDSAGAMMPRLLTANDSDLNTHRPRRMASRTTALSLLVLLVGTCVGCGKGQSPVQPTPAPPAPVTVSLRGAVHDTVFRPVADVRIEVVDGAGTDAVATSDRSGAFSLSGTFSNTITVQAVKDAYKTYLTHYTITQLGRYLSITLDLDAPSVDITG